jgi:hypothetical protein
VDLKKDGAENRLQGAASSWQGFTNSKSQITNIKQITITKIQNSKPILCLGH